MERTLSDYEKIKKAEEIYNRRKMREVGGVRVTNPTTFKTPKKEYDSVKKMILQICICVVLYFIVYLVQNSNYIFSEEFMNKTKELLSYDINFKEHISNIINDLQEKNWFGIFNFQDDENKDDKSIIENVIEEENNVIETEKVEENNELVENIINTESSEVGAIEENKIDTNDNELAYADESVIQNEPKSQMEIDADIIKNNYSLEAPLKGTITSPYGERSIAPKFHVGVDIGANSGTDIVSAMDGVAILVSEVGDYGKHIKISNGDLMTLYAHCSKLYVAEGQEIKKGQKIAEVGATGNATGPHLHFEVILERKIC